MEAHPPEAATWSLIARAAAGHPAARDAFGRIYLPVVRRLLDARWHSTPLSAEVDDAVQEVFVEYLRAGGVLARAESGRGELGGLLFGVTRNVALRFEERAGRRTGREVLSGSALAAIEAREPRLSALFDREWARALVRMAGERMRAEAELAGVEACRRVELLHLRFSEGLPLRDIAARWEEDPDAIHRAYAKARAEFRDCLRLVVAEQATASPADLEDEVRRLLELLP